MASTCTLLQDVAKLSFRKASSGLHTLDLARNSLAESIPALARALPKSRIQDLGLEERPGYIWLFNPCSVSSLGAESVMTGYLT